MYCMYYLLIEERKIIVENMINIKSGNCNNAYYPRGHMGWPNFSLGKVTFAQGNLDLENIYDVYK
jgi:hypothetical protein